MRSRRRQIESKAGVQGSYESQMRTPWPDRVTRLDRSPELWAARDIRRHKHDLCGNRRQPETAEQRARAMPQRRSAAERPFARLRATMTPAEANRMGDLPAKADGGDD